MKTLLQLNLNDDGTLSFFSESQAPFARTLAEQVFSYLKPYMPDLRHRAAPYEGPHPELANALKDWRMQVAREANIPAYYILHQKVLHAIADAAPETMEQLKDVEGMGPGLITKYGEEILKICGKD